MRHRILGLIAALAFVTIVACHSSEAPPSTPAEAVNMASPQPVRVAAIQYHSKLGDVAGNRHALGGLVENAARQGAKIVMLPECAVSGYFEPKKEIAWSLKPVGTNALGVATVAESIPGESTKYFGALAKRNGVYVAVGLIERADQQFYNAQVLLSPAGEQVAHHRKTVLWPPGDGPWATRGNLPPQVVDTPYGRVGLMISHEMQHLSPLLKEQNAHLVLCSTAWYGPNPDTMFTKVYPRRFFTPNGFAISIANWAADPKVTNWPGHGASCVIDRDGRVLALAKTHTGSEIVVGDVQFAPAPATR